MRIHYPKLRNMTHALLLSVFIAFKGTNFSKKKFTFLKIRIFNNLLDSNVEGEANILLSDKTCPSL